MALVPFPTTDYWMSQFHCLIPAVGLPEFENAMNYFERELERFKRSKIAHPITARDYSASLCSFPSRPTSLLEHYSFMNPIRIDVQGNRWLNCCFDLRSFKPEEINVTFDTKERCIHVEASHEVKDVKEHYVRRHYNRKFYLPKDLELDMKKITPKSFLTNEGLLYVEALLPKLPHEELQMSAVPVKHPYGSHFGFVPIKTFPIGVKKM